MYGATLYFGCMAVGVVEVVVVVGVSIDEQ
jgi:hypothetical protein